MKLSLKNVTQNNTLVIIILSIVVFIICVVQIPLRSGPAVLPDEIAQFAIAAYFLGHDWSNIMSAFGYYSYGYALLIMPFVFFASYPATAYLLSMILNALLAALLVPLSYALCKRWGLFEQDTERSKPNRIFIPIILFTAVSAAILAYSLMSWAEIALIVTAYSATLCFYKLQDKDCKPHWFSIQALLLVYGYVLHQRFLGMLIAGALVLLLMAFMKRISLKNAIIFFLTLALLYTAHTLIKNNIQANLWISTQATEQAAVAAAEATAEATTAAEAEAAPEAALAAAAEAEAATTPEAEADTPPAIPETAPEAAPAPPPTTAPSLINDYETVFRSLSLIFTDINHFVSLIRVAVGQMFYLGVASFLLLFFAIHSLAKQNFDFIRKIKEQKKDFDFTLMFMLVGFFFTYAISVLFMHNPNRGDGLVYGRYNTIIYTVLCLYILAEIIKGRYKPAKTTIFIAVAFVLMMLWTYLTFNQHFAHLRYQHFKTLNFFVFFRISSDHAFIHAGIVSAIIGSAIMLFQKLRNKNLARKLTTAVLIAALGISITTASLFTATTTTNLLLNNLISSSADTASKIGDTDLPVYLFSNQTRNDNATEELHLQYALLDRTLRLSGNSRNISHHEFHLIQLADELFIPLDNNGNIINTTFVGANNLYILHNANISDGGESQDVADVKTLHMTPEHALRIEGPQGFEGGFLWAAEQTKFLFSFHAETDYLFSINLPFRLPIDFGYLDVQFAINSYDNIIHTTTIDHDMYYIEFIVPREMLAGQHHILYMTGDTWSPAEGAPGIGMPISSITATPIASPS